MSVVTQVMVASYIAVYIVTAVRLCLQLVSKGLIDSKGTVHTAPWKPINAAGASAILCLLWPPIAVSGLIRRFRGGQQ